MDRKEPENQQYLEYFVTQTNRRLEVIDQKLDKLLEHRAYIKAKMAGYGAASGAAVALIVALLAEYVRFVLKGS